MIIDRLYLDADMICVVIQGREEIHLCFDLQNVPNVDRLVQMIKEKIAEIDAGGHTPPPTDWGPLFQMLKDALEGTDIGD